MKKKILIGIAIVLIISAFVAFNLMKNSSGKLAFSGGKAHGVKAKTLEKGEISSYVTASGTIEEVESARVFIDTALKVEKLHTEKNQMVEKGQKLMDLDMDSIYSELERLKINRTTQKLALDSDIMNAEVERAESALESSKRAYNDALKIYEKNKALYDASAISENELDMSEKAVLDAKTAVDNASLSYNTAVSNRSIDKETKMQSLKSIELSISDIEKQIRKINASLLCPISGVISELNIQEGSYTSSMTPALMIVNPDKLQARVNVKEYDIKNVKVGQEVEITGDGIDEEIDVKGRISSIAPVAKTNMTSGGGEVVIEVLIDIDKPADILRPGLSVNCDISTVSKKDVLVAPMDMFDEEKDGSKFAFVIDTKTQTMHKKFVKLGIFSDMYVEVTEGLNEGDLVVLNPQPVYKDGARVRVLNGEKK